MSESAGTEAVEATGTEGAEAAGQQPAGAEQQAAGGALPEGSTPAGAKSVEELPDWAQKIVRGARKEAGDYRTAAKTASDTATQSITEKLAAALGLKPEAAADPAALTQQLTQAQQEAADRARELAIYKAASAHGADPAKLLDSNSFMTSVKGLDPTDGNAVADAIKAAVTANQSLKAARAAGASGIELSGGSGEQGQITEQQLKTMTPEQITTALDKGLLKNLLG